MPGRSLIRFFLMPILFWLIFMFTASAQQNNNLRYVNPFIGTTKSNVLTKWGNNGGTYPGAVAPSGAIQLSPETRVTGNRGYDYTDSAIYYFSCFQHHSGFPVGSAGQFFIMPLDSKADFEAGKYVRRFSHTSEVAYPGYYKVSFEDDKTIAEATATARAGMFRFTFSAGSVQSIFIGDVGEVSVISNKILHFSHGNAVINLNDGYTDLKKVNGGWVINFNASSNVIEIKISASTVSFAGAQLNIDKEIGALTFDQVVKQTSGDWQKLLAKIDIADNNEANKTVFYTALYHSLLLPWVIDDVDGSYRGADDKVYKKSGQNQYGGFSPWDTFRSLHPLLTLLYPDKENDVILSMLDVYKQTGHLPTESMTGNHAIPIIVDSYLKGITGFDKALAYNAMKSNIVDSPFVQSDMSVYIKNGYVPFVRSESVTRTVEYAYDDWALSRYANEVIDDDQQAAILSKRSFGYRNLFDADELLFLPRNGKEFKINPGMSGYKEGDKWVYTYFVPQNGKDLINLLGGNERFVARLDSALTNNVILFDNETVFHLPYLFNVAGRPDLTQKWCRQIMQGRFSNSPGGLPGNDDLGSTSSWYIFSAIGIYPVCPGRPLYAIGSPLFRSVILHLPSGKDFAITCKNQSPTNNFIEGIVANGKQLDRLTISHSMLETGGKMTFTMSKAPGKWPLNKNPVELSETRKAAVFILADIKTSKTVVTPDEPFYLHFSLTNKGALGTKVVELIVNGKQYGAKNCLIGSGQRVDDSIACRLYPIGVARVGLKGSAPFKIRVVNPKVLSGDSFRITALSAKPIIKINEPQPISYMIQNIGGVKKSFKIPITINDTLVTNDIVLLEPGEQTIMKRMIVLNRKGFKHLKAGNMEIPFKVYQDTLETLLINFPSINNTVVIKDNSGFGNNGVVLPAKDHIQPDTGKLLLGNSCFVEVPNSASLDEMGETITMMAWIYPTEAGAPGLTDMLTKGDSHVLQTTDNKTLTFFAGGWGRGDCTVNLPGDWLHHWHHVAGVCTGKVLQVYIDGVLKGTTVLEDKANLSVSNKWTIGRNEEFPSERIFHGYIDKVKIFKAPLSGQQVFAIMSKEQTLLK